MSNDAANLAEDIKWNEHGLVPAIAQDWRTGEVLMLAWMSRESLELTVREFSLLEYLARSPGRVFTRAQILERVWDFDFDPTTNIVDAYIRRLRQKLGEHRDRIETVRGVGYRLRAEAPNDAD